MAGFRPGCLGKTYYRDIILLVIQDPQDYMKKKYMVTMTVKTNKTKESLLFSKTNK